MDTIHEIRWTEESLQKFNDHLESFSFRGCIVCGGTTYSIAKEPLLILDEQTTQHTILMQVVCEVCAHVSLFNWEKFESPDTPAFTAKPFKITGKRGLE